MTLNPRAQEGAAAAVGVRNQDGTWRTLTFTKKDRRRIVVEYHARGQMSR